MDITPPSGSEAEIFIMLLSLSVNMEPLGSEKTGIALVMVTLKVTSNHQKKIPSSRSSNLTSTGIVMFD
jgi:hypothetical protein